MLLASNPPSGSTAVSSRTRLFLEILAVYDVAGKLMCLSVNVCLPLYSGCLATGDKPKLLSPGKDDWW